MSASKLDTTKAKYEWYAKVRQVLLQAVPTKEMKDGIFGFCGSVEGG